MASSSVHSPSSESVHDAAPKRPLTRVPAWIPLSAFIGTSLALAIPLLMLKKQRSVLRVALKGRSAPPPRRLVDHALATPRGSSLPLSTLSSNAETPALSSSESDSASPGIGEMMSALSRMNASTALMAAKAFGIATAMVAVGGVGLAFGVKNALGVNDAREFGHVMRLYLWSSLPSLPQRILRGPETDEERQSAHAVAAYGAHEQWTWPEAEERLKRAYEEGGIGLWAQVALREVEAEARVEREKREREMRVGLDT